MRLPGYQEVMLMLDLLIIAVTIAFFIVLAGFTLACERL